VADWALGRGARRTGLAFAEAAARTAPQQPRYAWLAGRLLRGHGNARAGERWLRRAHRLAVAHRDWETQARSLTSLGNVCRETGRYPEAKSLHARSLRISQRFRLPEQEAMALHDLFVIAIEEGNRNEAERFARSAMVAYPPSDPRLPRLAHDVAYFWMGQGYFARALAVLQALRFHFPDPDDDLRVVGNMARAAGGVGDAGLFTQLHSEAESLIPRLVTRESLADAMLEMACGALTLGEWKTALTLAARAAEIARARSESDVIMRAEAVTAAAIRKDTAMLEGVMPERRMAGSPGDFADELVATLERVRADAV
jgi:tetratricopeptide (TPR) repeat protein